MRLKRWSDGFEWCSQGLSLHVGFQCDPKSRDGPYSVGRVTQCLRSFGFLIISGITRNGPCGLHIDQAEYGRSYQLVLPASFLCLVEISDCFPWQMCSHS